MRLKKLEISGFKSFRDKVVLDFSGGISAVVGPNGCGKSNIVDAIRWAMGEQRLRMLRGKKTDDVIFNGSADATPVGMAEVSITLSSDDGKDFLGDYADCSEVALSRKLFRDGESEYAINHIPCRLLDVREFFMGTGIGVRTYSLIEQNSVVNLVEAKPEDRRQFIEEAAGISKYKSRKESALRKMEATRQNMVRVHDIVREVKSQLNALSRQAKRTEQYRALKKSIKEAEFNLALQTYADLSEKKDVLEKSLQVSQAKEMETRTALKTLEASLEKEKVEALERESGLAGFQERLYKLKNEINIKEQGLAFHKKKTDDLALQKQRTAADIERLQGQLAFAAQEILTVSDVSGKSAAEIAVAEKGVNDIQSALEELKGKDRETHRMLEEKKVLYIDMVTRKANLKNMLTTLTRGIEDIQKKEEKDLKETDEQRMQFANASRMLEETKAGLARDEASLNDMAIRKQEVTDEVTRSRTELQEIEEKLSEIKQEAGNKKARLQSLREFQDGYAWCSEATKMLMSAGNAEGVSRDDFLGLVAEHIDVPKDYEAAVEAVLGDKLQYILVKSQRDGVKAIDYLKSSSLGRCSFVPLEVRHHAGGTSTWEHLSDAVRLIDVVSIKDDFKDVARCLLDNVLLIPNLDNGIALWKQNGFMGTFVTLEGDIISPQGVLTGGSKENGERSLLRNKREISELEEEVDALAALLEKETEKRQSVNRKILQWDEELVQLRSKSHQTEIQINGRKKDRERFEDETKRLQQRLNLLSLDRENLLAEIESATQKKEAVTRELKELETEETDTNEVIATLQKQWEEVRLELEQLEKQLTTHKVLLASLQQKREANIEALERLKATQNQMTAEIESRISDIENSDREIAALSEQIVADQEALKGLYKDYEELEAAISQQKYQHQGKESTLRELEAGLKEAGHKLDQLSHDSKELEVQYREVLFQIDSLKQHVQQRDYGDISSGMDSFERLEENALLELSEKLEKDRQAVDNFGEVNLMAVDEYQQLKERHEFLSAQESDLNQSLDSLQKTISRINQISRKRFADTFEAVNQHFKEVFARLFPGGRGELRLTDESDMLETGVDIDIQVPGKRTQNITLLSGGEKSLAAIALIFSIIFYRPSPFLVLDEVDAALDDANVSLFNGLLKDISINSQIIMVTHNKRSMEAARNMFGVTMQQQGISTLVSVNLQ